MHLIFADCFLIAVKVSFHFADESPPNFSRIEFANAMASMASPMTPAAGTAVMSERSNAASDFLLLCRYRPLERFSKGRDRLHVGADAKFFAVGYSAFEAAGTILGGNCRNRRWRRERGDARPENWCSLQSYSPVYRRSSDQNISSWTSSPDDPRWRRLRRSRRL